jgi:putative tryptophan/tyrosine transport system substrate-binding protein
MRPVRFFLSIALGLAFLSVCAAAQTASKVYRVGFLAASSSPGTIAMRDGVSQNLAQRGYVPDRTLAIEMRSADGKPARLPGLAKELADSGVDVIMTTGYPAARAAKDATATIPIVVVYAGDPVETDLAASLNRPGGNLTGISDMASELSVKRLDLLKEAVPGLKRVAMLWNADDLGMTTRYRAASAAAATLGIAVLPLGVREPDDFETAFAAMDREKPDGILMVTDSLTILNRKRVFDFAAAHRIPAIYEFDFLVRDGGLMSYGPDGKELLARLADLVDRILKGARPADLPFEQPTRFRFVINKKTADSLGLVLPAAVLERADEVIE